MSPVISSQSLSARSLTVFFQVTWFGFHGEGHKAETEQGKEGQRQKQGDFLFNLIECGVNTPVSSRSNSVLERLRAETLASLETATEMKQYFCEGQSIDRAAGLLPTGIRVVPGL